MAQYTQAQLDALDNAINTGARSISYDGKSTTFRNLEEMQALRSRMADFLAGTSRTGVGLASYSKGTAGSA